MNFIIKKKMLEWVEIHVFGIWSWLEDTGLHIVVDSLDLVRSVYLL